MAEQMTGAEMVIRALTDNGVEHIFGYPGGAALPIYDAMFQQDKIEHILVRHEQRAREAHVHAAAGPGREPRQQPARGLHLQTPAVSIARTR